MKRRFAPKRHVAVMTLLVTLGSGCLGAVKTTTRQLSEEAMSPVTVPIEQGGKAKQTLEGVNERNEEMNAALEEIGQ